MLHTHSMYIYLLIRYHCNIHDIALVVLHFVNFDNFPNRKKNSLGFAENISEWNWIYDCTDVVISSVRLYLWLSKTWTPIGSFWVQGWGQFHFFNSIPIPILLFSIPIPIPLLTISFNSNFNSNSNSNSGDFNSNSNSNSRDFKSRQSQFQKWPVDIFLEIYYNYTNNVHVYKIIVINTISFISLVKWL